MRHTSAATDHAATADRLTSPAASFPPSPCPMRGPPGERRRPLPPVATPPASQHRRHTSQPQRRSGSGTTRPARHCRAQDKPADRPRDRQRSRVAVGFVCHGGRGAGLLHVGCARRRRDHLACTAAPGHLHTGVADLHKLRPCATCRKARRLGQICACFGDRVGQRAPWPPGAGAPDRPAPAHTPRGGCPHLRITAASGRTDLCCRDSRAQLA
jgi:hypothetical protein